MLDIKGNSVDPRSARLSNFTDRAFVFDGVTCCGLEGILQALKCADHEMQKHICNMGGREAKRAGTDFNDWKESQILWWMGKPYGRSTVKYLDLITAIYDAAYEQDPTFKSDLLVTENEELRHTIGNPDVRDTVLTEVEMIYQLYRLRFRSLRGCR